MDGVKSSEKMPPTISSVAGELQCGLTLLDYESDRAMAKIIKATHDMYDLRPPQPEEPPENLTLLIRTIALVSDSLRPIHDASAAKLLFALDRFVGGISVPPEVKEQVLALAGAAGRDN